MARETFSSRTGVLLTMIGVAVGLGNVWRFPYMVGRNGGAAFVVVYVIVVAVVGIPALMTEWTLGRHTRRGPVGAFAVAGLPLGKAVGWFFFFVVAAATGYYAAVIGWVLYFALGSAAASIGLPLDASAILPPARGFDARSFGLQAVGTATIILASAVVLSKGVRSGIERVSTFVTPLLFGVLLLLIVRAITLPGAWAGVEWYLLKMAPGDIDAGVVLAALGQAIFSLALGGTFMVVYGSYLPPGQDLRSGAIWTAVGDTAAGLLAGLAIFPAVFAFGLEPAAGPGLIFFTLPQVFAAMPWGSLFAVLFFVGLLGVAWLSAIAALEVLVAGLADTLQLSRRTSIWMAAGGVFLLSLPPTINLGLFVPWDLTFGSGMQTLGALLAVVTVGWAMVRAEALRELGSRRLYLWVKWAIPAFLLTAGGWWLVAEVL
jgi:NSS family neurotransmitter:Na+ symporter